MKEGLNRVTLAGTLGMDPELKFTQGGQAVLRMRIATSETYLDKQSQRQTKTEWHTAVLWGKRGEAVAKYLMKGSDVLIEGSLTTRSWEDNNGNKRQATEVNVKNVVLLGDQNRRGGHGGNQEREERQSYGRDHHTGSEHTGGETPFDSEGDDIPF